MPRLPILASPYTSAEQELSWISCVRAPAALDPVGKFAGRRQWRHGEILLEIGGPYGQLSLAEDPMGKFPDLVWLCYATVYTDVSEVRITVADLRSRAILPLNTIQ